MSEEKSADYHTRMDGEGGKSNMAEKNWEGPVALGYSDISKYATSQKTRTRQTN